MLHPEWVWNKLHWSHQENTSNFFAKIPPLSTEHMNRKNIPAPALSWGKKQRTSPYNFQQWRLLTSPVSVLSQNTKGPSIILMPETLRTKGDWWHSVVPEDSWYYTERLYSSLAFPSGWGREECNMSCVLVFWVTD